MERHRAQAHGQDLRPEHCPVCASRLVEPVYWAQRDPEHWSLDLRCPDCETERSVTLGTEAAHAYSLLLYDAAAEVVSAVRQLEEAWSSGVAEVDRQFVEALRADRILPIDF